MRRAYASAYPHRPVPTDAELVELGQAEVLSFVDEDVEREAERAQTKAECERLSAGWVVCDHDGAPVSREVRHDVVCATCGVASVMVMRGSGRLLKIEYLFFIFVKLGRVVYVNVGGERFLGHKSKSFGG